MILDWILYSSGILDSRERDFFGTNLGSIRYFVAKITIIMQLNCERLKFNVKLVKIAIIYRNPFADYNFSPKKKFRPVALQNETAWGYSFEQQQQPKKGQTFGSSGINLPKTIKQADRQRCYHKCNDYGLVFLSQKLFSHIQAITARLDVGLSAAYILLLWVETRFFPESELSNLFHSACDWSAKFSHFSGFHFTSNYCKWCLQN